MLDPQIVEHFSNLFLFLLLISLHLYYMCTLSTLFFKLFKGYSIHLKKKEITDNFYLSVLPAPYMLLICTLITTDKMSTKYVQVYMYNVY